MLLTQISPSSNWEPLPLDASGQHMIWLWFRPAQMPNGLMIVIPFAVFAQPQLASVLSVRSLVTATGMEIAHVHCWAVNGATFDAEAGRSPMLDQLLPPPPPNDQLQLTIWMNVEAAPVLSMPMPMATTQAAQGFMSPGATHSSPGHEQLFFAIESSWNNIRQLENKVGSIRKQLDQTVSRLNSLNRDLTPEERRACDNKDTKDWLEARRWLRDSLATLGRIIKEIDLGTTSGAGQKFRFESIYEQHIAPRIPFPGLEQAVIEFDGHAKVLQNVAAAAQAALTRAGNDAEQRANAVLMRLTRSRSSKRK
jgi:hypothetical protein